MKKKKKVNGKVGFFLEGEIERLQYKLRCYVKAFAVIRDQLYEMLLLHDRKNKHRYVMDLLPFLRRSNGNVGYNYKGKLYRLPEEVSDLLLEYRERLNDLVYVLNEYMEKTRSFYYLASQCQVNVSDVISAFDECAVKIATSLKDTDYVVIYILKWLQTQLLRDIQTEKNQVYICDLEFEDSDAKAGEDEEYRYLYRIITVSERDKFFVGNAEKALIEREEQEEQESEKQRQISDAIERFISGTGTGAKNQ